jgi:hypothetical protein
VQVRELQQSEGEPMTDERTEELLEVARLKLKPGDVLVLRCAQSIGPARAGELRARLEAAFPEHRALVLDAGLNLEVVEQEEVHDASGV